MLLRNIIKSARYDVRCLSRFPKLRAQAQQTKCRSEKFEKKVKWGWRESECDVNDWPNHFQCGCGMHQSPVGIDMSKVQYSEDLKPLKINYSLYPDYMINDGQSIRVHYDDESEITGANLEGSYRLAQFHFHWGSHAGFGSEHSIDSQHGEAELHFVHWATKYGNIAEAMKHDDGLAVLGVFIKEDNIVSKGVLKPIVKHFKNLTQENVRYSMGEPMNIENLLPDVSKFVTYGGSLTTPPLTQCVRWMLLREPMMASTSELNLLRNLEDHFGPNFVNNFRPLQSLNGRSVESNFKV